MRETAVAVANIDSWLENFTEFEKRAAGRTLPWLHRLREDAFARFCETGFPTTKDEDWRFTNVSGIAKTIFRPAATTKLAPGDSAAWRVDDVAASLVFVNGRFDAELSEIGNLPKGVTVASLKEQIASHPEEVEKHLGRYADTQRDSIRGAEHGFHRGRGVRACGTRRGAGSSDLSPVSVDEGKCADHDPSAEPDCG